MNVPAAQCPPHSSLQLHFTHLSLSLVPSNRRVFDMVDLFSCSSSLLDTVLSSKLTPTSVHPSAGIPRTSSTRGRNSSQLRQCRRRCPAPLALSNKQ
ncbi:hypothetical protein BDP81DRAFT_419878 [Colletotrichum phormii]|uniref:Uncharacterized protein n=1 Tax=Colletotrichum phormii TaxID=359342 RepID=A0AAI9ZY27_9PEZI|nr:uncharacterized protein BDP81DRAFT_419878 [Colletotrichum phormii]KAK1640354.1 hypothetical protein BDP81DRAFT_419878 [Colletotrichum phormii]